jgi:hypothetical protein
LVARAPIAPVLRAGWDVLLQEPTDRGPHGGHLLGDLIHPFVRVTTRCGTTGFGHGPDMGKAGPEGDLRSGL